MAYCTLDDLKDQISEDELIQLTDDDGSGSVDMEKIDGAIASADALIDGYCGKHYSVPFSPTPPIIRDFSVIIAIYKLFARRQGAPEDRRTRYKEAVRFLEKVSEDKIKLGSATPATTHTRNSVEIESGDRIFTRDKMSGF